MFTGTPRLRDLLDTRSVLLIGAVALTAVGLQLALVAGTVASPLGEAVANFDRVPQVEGAPAEALASAKRGMDVPVSASRGGELPWDAPAVLAVEYRPDRAGICPR